MKWFQMSRRAPGRRWWAMLWVEFIEGVAHMLVWLLFRYRVHHRERIPREGSVIFICNHQSYLDPVLCGVATSDRPSRPLAREELFKSLPLRLMIKSLGALPLGGKASDKSALRTTLAELEAGRTVMIFPEGSRTFDGAMVPFKPGIGLLMKRSGARVQPMGIDGAFDAWPRGGRIHPGRRIECELGMPIESEELLKDGLDAAMRRLEAEVDLLRMRCRKRIRERTAGRQPAPGPGDQPFAHDCEEADE